MNRSMIQKFIMLPTKEIRLVLMVYFDVIDYEYAFLDVLTHAENEYG